MQMETVFALGIAVGPGLFTWWSGSRLLRLGEDPALPERLFARNRSVMRAEIFAIFILIVALRDRALWAVLLSVLGVAAGRFPARRQLLKERWGFGTYLAFFTRFWSASLGVWLLLAAAPAFLHLAGAARWPVAVSLGVLLLIWVAWYPEVFVKLLGAHPLPIAPAFAKIVERAAIRPPHLFWFDLQGGRMVNAFALPSIRASSVVFSDSILGLFEPDEQAAIFAHEVAHLEYRTFPRRLGWLISSCTLVCLGTVGAALVGEFSVRDWGDLAWFWPLLLFTVLGTLTRLRQPEEAWADRRAVDLCGDGEALVRALQKLHLWMRLPRSWGLDVERRATHPSLARRIQTIRSTTGTQLAKLSWPVVLATKDPTPLKFATYVLLEADRVTWLDGVPWNTTAEAEVLRAQAAKCRSVPYAELIEFRVGTKGFMGGPLLVVTDRTRNSRAVPLRPDDVARVQTALDAIDIRPALPPSLSYKSRGRWLSFAVMILGIATVSRPALVIAGFVGVAYSNRAALGSVAATALGAAALRLMGDKGLADLILAAVRGPLPRPWGPGWEDFAAAAGFCALAIVGFRLAFRQASPLETFHNTALPIGIMGLMNGAIWWFTRSVALPNASLLLLGVGGALLTARNPTARWSGIGVLAASLIVYVMGKVWSAHPLFGR